MKQTDQNELVAYLLDDLGAEAQRALELKIEASPALQQELKALREVLGQFDDQDLIEPSTYSRDQFYQFLEVEAKQLNSTDTRSSFQVSWRIAAAVALLVVGLGFGVIWQNNQTQQQQIRLLSAEVVETKKLLLLAMLEDASASERIKAMNVSTQEEELDQRIMASLIHRLHKDENENVRLKAAESLSQFVYVDAVVEALLQALDTETSPEIQITLIESLVNGERKEATPGFRRLLEREEVPQVVRDLAAHGLESMI